MSCFHLAVGSSSMATFSRHSDNIKNNETHLIVTPNKRKKKVSLIIRTSFSTAKDKSEQLFPNDAVQQATTQ